MTLNKEIKKIITILNKAVVNNIIIYDMKNVTPFYDFSVIASVNSSRQGLAAIDYLKKESIIIPLDVRGSSAPMDGKWFLIDLNNVVVHLFVNDERERYNLDGLYYNLDKKVIKDENID